MKRFSLLFAFLLTIVGGTSVWADTLTADFNSGLPEGWSIVGDLTNDDTRYRTGKGVWTYSKSDNANYLVTEALEGSLTFYARAYNKSTDAYVIVYAYDGSALGDQLYVTTNMKTSSTPSWSSYTADLGSYKGQVAIALNYAAIDDVTYTQKEVADGPALIVKDGSKVTSPYSYNFGLATAGTTHEFTLSNPGTEDLGVSVSETGDFNATLSATTITAGGEVTLTVTMPDATNSSVVTITPAASSGIDPFVINVNGTLKDPKKMFEDFSGNALPDGWETMAIGSSSASYSWSFTNGWAEYSQGSSYSHNYDQAIATPSLKFSDGEKVLFKAKKVGYNNPYLVVEYTTDGNNWTATTEGAFDNVFNTDWDSFEVTIPATAKQIRFNGRSFAIDDIYGGEPITTANLKFAATDYTFGMISEETTSEAFTIQNTGLLELTGLSITSNNENFVVNFDESITTIDAKSSVTFTVTMKTDNGGMQSGIISVQADGFDPITFNVSGYVADNSVILVNFKDNIIPDGWTNGGFTVSNNEISTGYSTKTLTSPAITVSEGQNLVLYVKGTSTYTAQLRVKTSTDNGNSWTTVKEFTTELRQSTTNYVLLTVDNISAGDYLLQIEGAYITIAAINGYNYNTNAPVLSVTPAEDATFGKVTAIATKTYTVANIGTGEMTVNIASDDDNFTVSPAQIVVTDEPQTFTVTFNYVEGNYGQFTANITVTPTYNEDAKTTIVATATAKNPALWDEDFEEGTLPTGWEATTWSVSKFTSYENKTYMAVAPSNSTAGTIITPRLEAKAGDVLTWDAYLNWYDEALIVEFSNDDKATWNEIYNYKTQDDTEAPSASERYYHKAMSFTAPADGYYYLRFTSTYQNGVDNFLGFKLALKEHDVEISNNSIPATGTQYVEYTATVKVKEMAGKEETVAAELWIGEEKVAEVAGTTIDANGEETITLTFTPDGAMSGDAYIKVYNDDINLETEKVTVEIVEIPVISENATEAPTATSYDWVQLDYTVNKGWNTIALPFAISDLSVFGEGVKLYDFTSFTDGNLKFTSTTNFYMSTPYVLYVETPTDKPIILKNLTISNSGANVENCYTAKGTSSNQAIFRGTFTIINDGSLEGKYGVTDEAKIAKGSASATMKGFRAYFELSSEPSRLLFDGEEVTTSIYQMEDGRWMMEDGIYNLNGQKVQKAQRGLYIINGKKVVIK